ncbi:hypothetical protein H0H93_015772, partial [Arthromyces matolae]
MTREEIQALERKKEKHALTNPFFLMCTKRNEHKAADFSPMSRFCKWELEGAIREMEEVVKADNGPINNGSSAHTTATASKPLPTPLDISAFIPQYLSPKTASIPTHPLPHYVPTELTPETFPGLWKRGEPLVVVGLLERFKLQWTPEYFIEKYGDKACLVIECQTEVNRKVTVGDFFKCFGRYEERKASDAG